MLKNWLVVDAILFSNLHEGEFASESYLANCIFYKSIRKLFPVGPPFSRQAACRIRTKKFPYAGQRFGQPKEGDQLVCGLVLTRAVLKVSAAL
jgi:hypothetical protein